MMDEIDGDEPLRNLSSTPDGRREQIDALSTPNGSVTIDLTVSTETGKSAEYGGISSAIGSDSNTPIVQDERLLVKPRSYQLEMLEQSLSRNIVVAMDTGSGKTHIAAMRISHTLDIMESNQLIFFLAPKVVLAAQQFDYLNSQITSVQIKFLSGADGCDRWTDQSLWDALLQDVRIVVSTPQILADALTHGFLRMERLALLVIDEAHNCTGDTPIAKIMKNFYHRNKQKGLKIPSILGLTASPLMKSNPASLVHIESTLDSICRSPIKTRADLQNQVYIPAFLQALYTPTPCSDTYTGSLSKLGSVIDKVDIMTDPYILDLKMDDSEKSHRLLAKVLLNHKTWTQLQLQRFYRSATTIRMELGAWAADYYISRVIRTATAGTEEIASEAYNGLWNVSNPEKCYLADILYKVEVNKDCISTPSSPLALSNKVEKLIEILIKQPNDTRGIVFVTERACVEVLAALLRHHPETKDRLRYGAFVGSSSDRRRARTIADIIDFDSQQNVLDSFRIGAINLIVATDVLEEGVDIPACNLVICFNNPQNLKSFVQRRGRARQKDSKLVMFFDPEQDQKKVAEFNKLEEQMKRIYADEQRELRTLILAEEIDRDSERLYCVPSTGALLDLDNSVSHLHHFCATLPGKQHADLRPDFICDKIGELFTAKVILPPSVDKSVRVAHCLRPWQGERNAIKDAAFEAYVALHKAGLIGDNLLPFTTLDQDAIDFVDSTVVRQASLVEVQKTLNPWIEISRMWGSDCSVYRSRMQIDSLVMDMFLPFELPCIEPFQIYLDLHHTLNVCLQESSVTSQNVLEEAHAFTYTIFTQAFSHRFPVFRHRQTLPLLPVTPHSTPVNSSAVSPLNEALERGLVWDSLHNGLVYVQHARIDHKPPIEDVQHPYDDYANTYLNESHISLRMLPKPRNFLRKDVQTLKSSVKKYSTVLPESRCIVGDVPFEHVRLALILPSLLHHLGLHMLAKMVNEERLQAIGISSSTLIRSAICASSAGESTNYQRLEFLGDSILKLCTTIQLIDEHPLWHEGLLSSKKDRLVSNGRLARAAIEKDLDKYIVTEQFTVHKWRPLYINDLASQPESTSKRVISSKVLADVVESLIGVAMIDGGIKKSLKCLSNFIPDVHWKELRSRQGSLNDRASSSPPLSVFLPVQELLGYKFDKGELLVEALTHSSCMGSTAGSLERFEFLGDSILDYIVVSEMWSYHLSHKQMHLLRTAMVNADFLAWLCLESSAEQVIASVNSSTLTVETNTEYWPLWRYLRHSSPALAKEQRATAAMHLLLRDEINQAIKHGRHYPWSLLARLDAGKFFSDMIESLIGAIWIDSYTKMPAEESPRSTTTTSDDIPKNEFSDLPDEPIFATCKAVLERLGILPYMRRILRDKVHVLHPKEELGILADNDTVKYVVDARTGKDGKSVEYLCTVFVGEEEIVSVDDGVSKVEVKTKAAEKAVRILKERKVERFEREKEKENVDVEMDDGEDQVAAEEPLVGDVMAIDD